VDFRIYQAARSLSYCNVIFVICMCFLLHFMLLKIKNEMQICKSTQNWILLLE